MRSARCRVSTVVRVRGRPGGTAAWRRTVADAAPPLAAAPAAVELRFGTAPRQFVDLDTVTESTVAGLRDAGWWGRGFGGLEALLATRAVAPRPGLLARTTTPAALRRRRPPGPIAAEVAAAVAPRQRLAAKRAWRDDVAAAWGSRPPLTGPVWADVALATRGSLLAPVEVVLDGLEPVLGRDPRGRAAQEFFPADDRIVWLRLRRAAPAAPGVVLRLGSAADGTGRGVG